MATIMATAGMENMAATAMENMAMADKAIMATMAVTATTRLPTMATRMMTV